MAEGIYRLVTWRVPGALQAQAWTALASVEGVAVELEPGRTAVAGEYSYLRCTTRYLGEGAAALTAETRDCQRHLDAMRTALRKAGVEHKQVGAGVGTFPVDAH